MRPSTKKTRGSATKSVQATSVNSNGQFHSLKMGKVISYSSQIERDFLYLLDYEPCVQEFRAQPFSIEIPAPDQQSTQSAWHESAGTWVRYTPDFVVNILPPLPSQPYCPSGPRHRRSRECDGERALMVEVLPSALASGHVASRLFETLTSWCKERTYGLEFCYITDKQVRAGCYLDNVKVLRQFAHHIVQPETRARIHGLLENAPDGIPIGELAQAVDSLALDDAVASVLHLAYQHEIVVPIGDWVLSSQTQVYSPYCLESLPTEHPLVDLLRGGGMKLW